MPQYLVTIQHPDNYDPSLEGEAMVHDIKAKSLRKQPGGDVVITDGP